ncbi:sensor histidine kinase [Streptomyces sp. NBC_01264]|uniref:sensor histidine kinase n=1 Tax=Streptomyces sp. NBC_01264 TaxID=2903804 RepID=UPI002256097A|nr:sensor histidine kinase [Streptomyces sp. NBC_01264]MCX4775535.1 sensor histidine kinase [Streptomyces sp. NBC_01264]
MTTTRRPSGSVAQWTWATAAVHQDPAVPHAGRRDTVLALVLMALAAGFAVLDHEGKPLDALGWVLLVLGTATVAFRRTHTMPALVAMVVFIGVYHALGYNHVAPTLSSMTLLYTVAVTGPPRRALIAGAVVIAGTVGANWISDAGGALATLRISGWIAAVCMAGVYVRAYRQRAERAERTQEEVAARRVAEERLRIARDLHDLLAHSITLIGVQTSVASHVLNVAPDQLDRAAIAEALDNIADTCRTARAEVRTTLEVLRHGESAQREGPLPDIAALPALARQADARLTRHTEGARIRPAVQAAVYRITQEALTNTSRHGGPEARADITLTSRDGSLYLTITDNGRPSAGTTGSRFGLIGMEERARSVGGSLTAGPRSVGGFAVHAVLPLTSHPATAREDRP